MSSISFVDDPFSRKVTRLLVLLQIVAMVIVVGLSFIDLFFLALAISFLTLFVFIISILWLYARYRDIPVIREKRELKRLVFKFQKGIQTEGMNIQAAIKERGNLFQAQREEISTALRTYQKNHLENGLAAASIQVAAIQGVGPELKERLAGHGILSAVDITEKISELPGFGEGERQALIDWRSSIAAGLESTRPEHLPQEQLESIKQKYQPFHNQNNAAERKARASQQMLEYELVSFRPRLQQLAPFTFVRYLSKSLAARGIVAAPLALVLITTQVVSTVSATVFTTSSFMASVPSAAALLPITGIKSQTATSFATLTSISTNTTIPISTLTATSAPTETISQTAAVTDTPLPSFTPRPQPSNTPYIPVSGDEENGNCDPSYLGVCIPPPPPDLDCGEIPYRRFQVLSPDPHYFDRDGDGIGCES